MFFYTYPRFLSLEKCHWYKDFYKSLGLKSKVQHEFGKSYSCTVWNIPQEIACCLDIFIWGWNSHCKDDGHYTYNCPFTSEPTREQVKQFIKDNKNG